MYRAMFKVVKEEALEETMDLQAFKTVFGSDFCYKLTLLFWKNLYLSSVTIKTKSLKYFFSWSLALRRDLFSYKTDLMLFSD